MTDLSIIVGFIVLFLLIILASMAIKIVRDYQRLVIFRLGRCIGQKGPGLIILIPIIDQPVWVDLRELFLEIPSQTCITRDNAPISIDFLIYWKVMDPERSVIQVANFAGHGARESSYVEHTDFSRQGEQPNEVIRIRYDSFDNLVAMGVIRRHAPPAPRPNAFQESPNRYVPDPPGDPAVGLR